MYSLPITFLYDLSFVLDSSHFLRLGATRVIQLVNLPTVPCRVFVLFLFCAYALFYCFWIPFIHTCLFLLCKSVYLHIFIFQLVTNFYLRDCYLGGSPAHFKHRNIYFLFGIFTLNYLDFKILEGKRATANAGRRQHCNAGSIIPNFRVLGTCLGCLSISPLLGENLLSYVELVLSWFKFNKILIRGISSVYFIAI